MSKEKVIELLKELGNTSDEVANKLQSLSIKGNTNLGCQCPIAKYLISNGIDIGISGVRAASGKNGYLRFNNEWLSIIDYPELSGVIDFILDFDAGYHSHLQLAREASHVF